MILLVGKDNQILKNIDNALGSRYSNERQVDFKRGFLNPPQEKDGSLPTRLSLIGHTTGSADNLTFEGCTAKQLVSRLMSELKAAALIDPRIKHSIKDIDMVSCGLGHINPKTGKSFAIDVANLLAIELEKEGFAPIQLKTFTNLYGEGQQNYVEELLMKVEGNDITLFGTDTIANAEKIQSGQEKILVLDEKRSELITEQVKLESVLSVAKKLVRTSENAPKPDVASKAEHDKLVIEYKAVLNQHKAVKAEVKKLDEKIETLCEKVSSFQKRHEKIFLKTQDIRATFDKEPTFNISVAAEELNKILKKPANVASNANQRGTFFHSAGEQKPNPANVISNPANNPNRFQRG